jgi:hypothetical protein
MVGVQGSVADTARVSCTWDAGLHVARVMMEVMHSLCQPMTCGLSPLVQSLCMGEVPCGTCMRCLTWQVGLAVLLMHGCRS